MRRFLFVFALLSALSSGCNSDPTCQRTIGMLRAEKLELENEYFALQSRYETALAQLQHQGATVPSFAPSSLPPSEMEDNEKSDKFESLEDALDIEAPEIDSGGTDEIPFDPPQGNTSDSPAAPPHEVNLSRFIKSIDVDQLEIANLRNGIKMLVRPLDERGEVIPIAGDLRVRLMERAGRVRSKIVEQWTFPRSQVASWINDQPNQLPGIHLSLPWKSKFRNRSGLRLDLQFRTADDRVVNGEADFVTENDPQDRMAGGIDDVVIEIGDEQSVDASHSVLTDEPVSRQTARKRPRWKPSR